MMDENKLSINGRQTREAAVFESPIHLHAHGGPEHILHNPEEGKVLRMPSCKSDNQPRNAESVTDHVRQDVPRRDVPEIFRPGPPDDAVVELGGFHQSTEERVEHDLAHGLGTSKRIHDLHDV